MFGPSGAAAPWLRPLQILFARQGSFDRLEQTAAKTSQLRAGPSVPASHFNSSRPIDIAAGSGGASAPRAPALAPRRDAHLMDAVIARTAGSLRSRWLMHARPINAMRFRPSSLRREQRVLAASWRPCRLAQQAQPRSDLLSVSIRRVPLSNSSATRRRQRSPPSTPARSQSGADTSISAQQMSPSSTAISIRRRVASSITSAARSS